MTHDPDDIGNHRLVHAKLLDRVAHDFIKSGHDSKALLRWICLSNCYGLSSIANKTNDSPEHAVAFGRQRLRSLTKEQVIDSLLTALQIPQVERAAQRKTWLHEIARPRFDEDTVEENHETYQRLFIGMWLMNNNSFDAAMKHKDGTLASILRKHRKIEASALQSLYLHVLSRPATLREMEVLMDPRIITKIRVNQNVEVFTGSYYEDVFWVLLNSGESAFNH